MTKEGRIIVPEKPPTEEEVRERLAKTEALFKHTKRIFQRTIMALDNAKNMLDLDEETYKNADKIQFSYGFALFMKGLETFAEDREELQRLLDRANALKAEISFTETPGEAPGVPVPGPENSES